jgi:hypothetical protein
MFLKKSSYDEFASELENRLQKFAQAPILEKQAKQETAIKHLLAAAEILDEINLEKQANIITKILERFAWEVPNHDAATSGLTSEKMVSNLENKGTVFNAEDGEIIDVVDPNPGEIIEMQPDGELEISNDEVMCATAHTKSKELSKDQVDLDIDFLLKKKN